MTDQKAAGEVTREHRDIAIACVTGKVRDVFAFDQVVGTVSQAIASACHQRDQRIAELEAELSELKSQANEYGPVPAVNLAELAADWATVRNSLPKQNRMGLPSPRAAFDRIEAALGLKG